MTAATTTPKSADAAGETLRVDGNITLKFDNYIAILRECVDADFSRQLEIKLSQALARVEALEGALRVTVKALEYCAVEPGYLHPANNAQHAVAMNALPAARAALGKKEG